MQTFLAQLNAQGPEKGGGFDRGAFNGLDLSERPEVQRLLRQALLKGDSTAAAGLVLFDRGAAAAVLCEVLDQTPFERGVGVHIAGELWLLTHDLRYQEDLVRYLGHPRRSPPMVALSYLKSTPRSPVLAPELKRYLLKESDPIRRSMAAALLFVWLGTIPDRNDACRLRRDFMNAMESPNVEVRRSALEHVVAATARPH